MKLRHRHRQAARETGPDGFAEAMTRHVALFYPRGDTLVVSFDNMKSREQPAPAYPWAFDALRKAGHSHLGIMMTRRNDWFRHGDLVEFFDGLKIRGFFDRFGRVVFYGSSMGGYGALAYSAACPGADVLVFAPQTSLDQDVVPFETRYRRGFARGDWQGRYTDGAVSARSARQVMILADPHEPQDAAHVARLPAQNLVWLRCPFFGHNPARLLKLQGTLGAIVRAGWNGTLTPAEFTRLRRDARGNAQGLARQILSEALRRGHEGLVRKALEQMSESQPDWSFPRFNRCLR